MHWAMRLSSWAIFCFAPARPTWRPSTSPKPAFALRSGDAGDQVVVDVGQSCPMGLVRAQGRAADAGFSAPVLRRILRGRGAFTLRCGAALT